MKRRLILYVLLPFGITLAIVLAAELMGQLRPIEHEPLDPLPLFAEPD